MYNGCVENVLIYILAPVHRNKINGMLLKRQTPSCHTEWFVYVKFNIRDNNISGPSYWQSLPLYKDDGILRKTKFETKEEAIMYILSVVPDADIFEFSGEFPTPPYVIENEYLKLTMKRLTVKGEIV